MSIQLLDVDYTLYREDLKVLIPVMGTVICFIIFWFSWQNDRAKEKRINKYGEDRGRARHIIHTKVLGGLLLSLAPAIGYLLAFPETSFADFGWSLPRHSLLATAAWTFGLGSIVLLVIANNAKKPANLLHYPQIRAKQWDRKMIWGNLLGWTVYLVGYEALFRGVLLFPLVDQIGLWPALAINMALASATHLPKGIKETLGAMPLALAFCLICLHTGNIWAAAIIHAAMAWVNTTIARKHHPEMQSLTRPTTLAQAEKPSLK